MLKIIAITLSLVGTIYILTAIFGYRTFYNYTASEFLTAFEYLHFENFGINMQIILAKVSTFNFSKYPTEIQSDQLRTNLTNSEILRTSP